MSDPCGGDPLPPGVSRPALPGRRLPAPVVTGRLPSMRSRDLTLGGVKKKTFTPNIISRKAKEEQKVEGHQKKERKERERDRQRDGRGRGRGRPEIIQSHSIFEQGPAEMMMKKRGGWENERDTPTVGPSPIINIKKEKRETEEETKEILRMLERDNFLDDPRLCSDLRSCPVQLPLAISGWVFKEESNEENLKGSIKSEGLKTEEESMELDTVPTVKVKQEPMDVPVIKKVEPSSRPPSMPEEESLKELLIGWSQSKGEELLFLQLPDTLPGQPPTQEQRPIKTEVQTEDGQSVLVKTEKSQEVQLAENTCSLADLAEGQVGKLLVRKSGRVQLVLGQNTLDISLGTPCSFLQELVSVGAGDGRTGDLTVLGHITHKLVCSPDFHALLENRA
uniref:RNA polymerase III subunit D n=1 Tax=Lepisosteus oculatus TaxID=7918 RepID=W5NGQ5_LEPOC|nr:PREDICTED: DNA-directed RNA polymerase III subunit RPC4 [Lepisosteus oculatus]XP_015202072.1 PREDICTED: DNA-directed RNA polymerase III subunit RPC4 [Lepisosteus oculatus]